MARPDKYDTVYLDSNAIIRYVQQEDGWHIVRKIVDASAAGTITLLSSSLLLVEALGQRPRPDYDPQIEGMMLGIIDTPNITPVEFSRTVALRARQLVFSQGLDTCDSVHLASAIEAGSDAFMTYNSDDFPIGTAVDGVWVDVPYFPDSSQFDLFDPDDT